MPRLPSCSGCCIRQTGCTACARCLPKYLCVDVTVTPGQYSDLTCCEVDSYGQGHFSFRMPNVCDAWSGSETCAGLDVPFDLAVTLDSNCNTVVSSSLSESPLVFAGVLPAGMSGTFDSDSGDTFDWEISRAAVVENPLIRDKIEAGICPPCSCATCLPERLCVKIAASGDAYNPDVNTAVSMLWDCHTRSWLAEGGFPDGVSVSLGLKSAASGICGIDVSVSGNYGEYTGVIVLEGGLNSRKFHGTLCKDSDLLISTLGVPELRPCVTEPCDDPPPQEFVSYIDATINLMDGDVQVGTVSIRDQSCGTCVVEDCTSSPVVPTISIPCCPDNPIPVTLHVYVSGCSSASGTLTAVQGVWSGLVGGTDPFRNNMTFTCGSGQSGPEWSITWPYCNFAPTPPVVVVCGPIDVTFNGDGSGCPGCSPGPMTIEIVS